MFRGDALKSARWGLQTARSRILRRILRIAPVLRGGPKPRTRPANCAAMRQDCIGPDRHGHSPTESPVPAAGKNDRETGRVRRATAFSDGGGHTRDYLGASHAPRLLTEATVSCTPGTGHLLLPV